MEGQTTQAIRKKSKWKDRQHNDHQKEGQSTQWPSERRVNGRTDNTSYKKEE